jgi:Smg protein
MIDILVYVFESYGYPEACPEPEQLARKLTAAGFDPEEIDSAIEWLSGLRGMVSEAAPAIAPDRRSFRIYSEAELVRLSVECRGFLALLEDASVFDSLNRERIIERAMALPGSEVSLSKIKVIVLMVLWQQQENVDLLVLEELLTDEGVDEPGVEQSELH